MDRKLLVVAIALVYSAPSLAAGENQAYDGYRHTTASYHENGFDGARPISRTDEYNQLAGASAEIEEKSLDYWLDRSISNTQPGIGLGVAPLFDAYGVFRTSSDQKKPAYVAFGYISEELIMDDADTPDSMDDRGFSFGFGVNDSSFSFEYMMSVDEQDYEVSAIGVGFISEF
ncbi:MAG: hypothetical protein JSU67_12230 [Gammaproteobacteria bacterium]|nr:MAG: hypothetical protein JSU67_12230 [Gammaproteobacteria bacterium]